MSEYGIKIAKELGFNSMILQDAGNKIVYERILDYKRKNKLMREGIKEAIWQLKAKDAREYIILGLKKILKEL